MKFEMSFGWIGEEKIIIETHDFEKIQIIQEFIQFQEEHGWAVEYEATNELELAFEEEEDTEEELEGSESKE
jgi:hypothetical protein